ncbi:signal peptidase I [Amycolatopsis alba DSM 44262]|uniref:Signal peptidase I n=2 Tax=Amycolatopsis alba TaxID=76020 RepID=A0A229R6Z4_AMYAL|nr:signal peptidase I [Amycolatopsis alba DSM 44262]
MILVAIVGLGTGGYGFWTLMSYRMMNVVGVTMSPAIPLGSVLVYRWADVPEIPRGAVVLVDLSAYPGTSAEEGMAVQRVIGVGGDHVVCCTNDNLITVDGKPVKETYTDDDNGYGRKEYRPFDVEVPPGTVYLAGDRRNNSADSRIYADKPGKGAVPLSKVRGVVVGSGSLLNAVPSPQTTAFVEAGLPGDPLSDTGFRTARILMVTGAGLVMIGFLGAIASVVRSAGKRRKAAAIPPVR